MQQIATVSDADLTTEELTNKYSSATNINCSETNCKAPNVCLNNSTCMCYWSYLNFKAQGDASPEYCSYVQAKQSFFFLWEWSFGTFGVGHFYAGRIGYGLLKLFLTLAPCLLSLILYFIKGPESVSEKLPLGINCVVCCSWIIIQFIDLINIGNNAYRDHNGMPTARWTA